MNMTKIVLMYETAFLINLHYTRENTSLSLKSLQYKNTYIFVFYLFCFLVHVHSLRKLQSDDQNILGLHQCLYLLI